ncbi:MAG: penicillin-binding protein 2 [Parcubacteria group bacterium]|nr:penicillin-binding protein 2 [Parcubacteria group bacterium]
MRRKNQNLRLLTLGVFFFILGLIIVWRLWSLQIKQFQVYEKKAVTQRKVEEVLNPQRGEIYIQDKFGNLEKLAARSERKIIFAVPKDIRESKKTAGELAPILEISEENLELMLKSAMSSYKRLKVDVSDEVSNKISAAKISGIGVEKEEWRFYPLKNLAAEVVGFVGFDKDKRKGVYGIEASYNKELEGLPGFLETEKDLKGRQIFLAQKEGKAVKNGSDIILTIDRNIQFESEELLKKLIEKWNAEAGTVIVMEPSTGKILALADEPSFDPNQYKEVKNPSVFLNNAVQKVFEPGSIFKLFTMAAGLDSELITPDTKYKDEGSVKISGITVKNFTSEVFGWQTMTQILEKSLNTGAVFVGKILGRENFLKYVEKFGFGEKTGLDLNGELSGLISNLKSGKDIDFLTATFGQGVAVTPIQLVSAVGALANQGKLMRPYLVDKILSENGETIKTIPQVRLEAISPETARKISEMMVSVVDHGFDKARINGYFIAGKTGTAQVALENKKGYAPDRFIHGFAGFAPAFNPRFVALIKLDNPKGIAFAADSLSPSFRDLTQFIFNYYEIPPDY